MRSFPMIELEKLDYSQGTVMVDMAGNRADFGNPSWQAR